MPFVICLICAAFASAEPETIRVNLKPATDFAFSTVVPAYSEVLETQRGLSELRLIPCAAPQPCIQFYPRKRSLQISGNLENGYAAITLIPEKATLPSIAVVMMQGDEWFPELPGVQCIAKIHLTRDFTGSRILEFNEDIKAIILHGNIKHYSELEPASVLQVLRPYDQNKANQRTLLRVTGKMETSRQSFTLTSGPSSVAEYVLMPSEETTTQTNVEHVFDWPVECN